MMQYDKLRFDTTIRVRYSTITTLIYCTILYDAIRYSAILHGVLVRYGKLYAAILYTMCGAIRCSKAVQYVGKSILR